MSHDLWYALATIIVSAPVSIVAVQALKRAHWSDLVKIAVTVAICIFVGVAQAFIDGAVTSHMVTYADLAGAIIAVFSAAELEYHAVFEGMDWMSVLEEWLDTNAAD